MSQFLRAAIAAAFALACAPAMAQSSSAFIVAPCVTATGGDSTHVPYCSPVTASNPLPISGTFSASFSGFQPTPSYSTLAVGASSTRVALPTGTVVIVYNTGANAASVTLGSGSVVATGSNDIIQPNSWVAFTVGSFVDLAAIEATGAAGTTSLVISGGAGLPTGAGGGGGGSASFPSVYAAPGATSPANTLMVGAQQGTSPGVIQNLIVDATQALKVTLGAGAATAANQSTEISSLSTIATNTTGASTAANQTTANTSLSTIATNTLSPTVSHASTTALAAALSAKTSAGNLLGFNCTAITGGAAGFCVVYNSTTTPGSGALTGSLVLDFCYFDTTARGCSLGRGPDQVAYSAGIQVLVTSAASPYTYTTGTDTAAISADFR